MKKKILILSLAGLLLVSGVIWVIWENTTVGLTQITVKEDNLPYAFHGFRIAHVSDLHNSNLADEAILRLKEAKPNLIVITGDLVDCRNPDVEAAMKFIRDAVQITGCFYVTGNHENNLPADIREQLFQAMKEYGVVIMTDTQTTIHRKGANIALVGHHWESQSDVSTLTDFDGYRILLSHTPEHFEAYAAGEYDLVFSGHAHGGQVRLPLLGGLFAPGQGLLPKYDSGVHTQGRTDMVVSRGIGNSAFPIRFNNQPEVILVILECE